MRLLRRHLIIVLPFAAFALTSCGGPAFIPIFPVTRAGPGPQAAETPQAPQPAQPQPKLTDNAEFYAQRVSKALDHRPEPRPDRPEVLWIQPQSDGPQQPAPQPAAAPQPPPPKPRQSPSPPSPTTLPAIASAATTQPVCSAPLPAPNTDLADATALASRLAACIDNDTQPPLAKAVRLASLRVVEPEAVADPLAVPGLEPHQQQTIKLYQELVGSLAARIAAGEMFSRDLMFAHLDTLALAEPLRIRNMQLCGRVKGFGAYEPLDASALLVGRNHPMIVYLELDHFRSLPVADHHEVRLSQELVLYNEADGLAVWRQPRVQIVDQSRNTRRDFFVVQQIDLPARLSVGKYLLKVRVTDLQAQTIDERTCPIQVVADPSLAAASDQR